MDTATVVTTVGLLAGTHFFLQQQPTHEKRLDEQIEVVDRDVRFMDKKRLLKLRREDVSHVEQVANNSLVGTPRYFVHLTNGGQFEIYGHVVDDFIDPSRG